MSSRRAAIAVSIVGSLLCWPSATSFACACCSEEGQHLVSENGKTSDLQIGEMSFMKFAPSAKLFVGAGDKEDARGIRDPSYEYAVEAMMDDSGGEWRLTFRNETGNAGTLWLPVKGAKMSSYKIDIHDGAKSGGGGPLLYKEWKFRGRARGDGIFKEGFAAPASYTLIFQGRGNNCDASFDFTHWLLDVSGSKADFILTGELVTSAAGEPAEG